MPEMAETAGGRRSFLRSLTGTMMIGGLAGCLETVARVVERDEKLPFEFSDVEGVHALEYETTGADIANTSAGVYITDFNSDGYEDVLLVGGECTHLYQNIAGTLEPSDSLLDVNEYLLEDERIHSEQSLDSDNDGVEELLLFPGGREVLADYTAPVGGEVDETNLRPVVLQTARLLFHVANEFNEDTPYLDRRVGVSPNGSIEEVPA